MSNVCNCGGSLGNTGTPTCVNILGVTRQVVMVPLYDNDGDANVVVNGDTLDAAYFTDLVNETDASKRWYPTGLLKNITLEKGDPVYKTWDDESVTYIHDGIRKFTGIIVKGTPQQVAAFNEARCGNWGVYHIDNEGNLWGIVNADGDLAPIPVDASSANAKFVYTTDKDIQQIMLSWNYSITVDDSALGIVSANDISGINLVNLRGLMDATIEFVSCGQTSTVLKLKTNYGTLQTKTPVTGLVANDFLSAVGGTAARIYNVTDSAAVTVTCAESPSGTYTLTYTSQSVSDVLRVTPSKNGYSFTAATDTIV